ncbi:hypothetical protein N499_0277A, partial [Wolbachia pipientis wVitA]
MLIYISCFILVTT